MYYCDVVRGTSKLVGPFSGKSDLESVYDFNTKAGVEGENNNYRIYRKPAISFDEIKKNAYYIRPLFFEDGYVVKFETNIPHKEFKWVDEIGEPYCIGILFALSDCK